MPVDIHGKQYVMVHERIQEFHELYPNVAIHCHIMEDAPEGIIRMTAMVCPDVSNSDRHFSGHAEEIIGSSQINKTSSLENAETSAIGRALGFLGLGISSSIASADEVQNAIHQQKIKRKTTEQKDMFKQYIVHSYFQTLDHDGVPLSEATKTWWRGLITEPQADSALVSMLKRMTKHDEKLEKQKQKRIEKNEDK